MSNELSTQQKTCLKEESCNDNNKNVIERIVTDEDVVNHSYRTNSNIIALSIDECDSYSSISFKIGKQIKSQLLLATLLSSRNILGKSKIRKVTIKNIREVYKEILSYHNVAPVIINEDSDNTPVLDEVLNSEVKENISVPYFSKELIKNKIKNLDKSLLKTLLNEISSLNELHVKDENILSSLAKDKVVSLGDCCILLIQQDLFLYFNKSDSLTGYLCSVEGLKILLNNTV